jgi:hypothetical protein
MSSAIEEYEAVLERIFSVYIDAIEGLGHIKKVVASIVLPEDKAPPKVRDESGRSPPGYLIYALGTHGQADYIELCSRTPEQIVDDNRENGPNGDFIAKMCVVAAYQFWDDHYRAKIAAEIGTTKEKLKLPIFGDLRRLRRCIIHDRSRWSDALLKMECFDWEEEDRSSDVTLSKSDIMAIWWKIRLQLNEIKTGKGWANQTPHPTPL